MGCGSESWILLPLSTGWGFHDLRKMGSCEPTRNTSNCGIEPFNSKGESLW